MEHFISNAVECKVETRCGFLTTIAQVGPQMNEDSSRPRTCFETGLILDCRSKQIQTFKPGDVLNLEPQANVLDQTRSLQQVIYLLLVRNFYKVRISKLKYDPLYQICQIWLCTQ